MLGLGKERVELVPADEQGRISVEKLPTLDQHTLLILQAGNVNSGALGLWAEATKEYSRLTKGIEKADSWSVDAHKTLNAPYDCGIVLCKNRPSLISAMQATASYIQYSENRDGMLYTPDMSRRARAIELWATLKYLGKDGVRDIVEGLCDNARYFAEKLKENGFEVMNEVVFNQILVKHKSANITRAMLKKIQSRGKCWCGGAIWQNEPIIRISVCSWQTTKEDIDDCIETFKKCCEA